jgi:hypothetical protein
MRIEEFLRENGRSYSLRVLGEKDDKLHIEIQTLEWDGDESTKEYLVKDNVLFPIE